MRKYPETSEWIDKFTGTYGFETIIVARSFTLVTFDLVAYAAGISSIELPTFAAASFISLIPVALNSTLVGLALTSGSIGRSVLLVAFTSMFAIALAWSARKYRLSIETKRAEEAAS